MSFESLSLILIGLCLLGSFIFSCSETALTAASRARIYQLKKGGNKRAALVYRLLQNRDHLIGVLLIGNNIVNTAASTLATGVLLVWFGEVGLVYATVLMAVMLILFSEITPKTLALYRPEQASLALVPIVNVAYKTFGPISTIANLIIRALLRLFGIHGKAADSLLSAHDELRGAVDLMHREGIVKKEDRDMLGGLLDLSTLTVVDVMIHRTKMHALDSELPPEELVAQVLASPYTRLPLYKDKPENIIGVLHAKDLLRSLRANSNDVNRLSILDLISPPWFVPETTPLLDQLKAFRKRKAHFALAVDEYGEVMGLVTLEDILEEIVGDIADEFDVTVSGVRPQADGTVLCEGTVPIRDLNRAMDWHLPDEDATTVAGLVIHTSGILPDVGQSFQFYGMRFEVMRRVKNRVALLRIKPLTASGTSEKGHEVPAQTHP